MDPNPQKEPVTKIAAEDLQRRRQEIAPQVDANIEALLKICEQRLKEAGEPPAPRKTDQHWDAEFAFWHRIISEETARTRFNQGYEPIDIELYETGEKYGPAYIGKTQVGRTHFHVIGRLAHDKLGRKILKIEVRKAP